MAFSKIDAVEVSEAVQSLQKGLLVAFPTETVYGLGADATNAEALKRLYKVKGRPENHPVIVHLHSLEQLQQWAETVPEGALKLAQQFWPGPLTLILPKRKNVLEQVTGGQGSVGLRIPNHPLALALLREFGNGVAAPSANKFGRLSPTTAEDVRRELGDDVALVLDGGPCDVGIESTIVDFTGSTARILRPGMILPEQIEKVLGADIEHQARDTKVRAPGGLPSHYAPRTALKVVSKQSLTEEIEKIATEGKKLCVLSITVQPTSPVQNWLVAPNDAYGYARVLYKNLRRLDKEEADLILVEKVPEETAWTGIADRLHRASMK